MSAQLRVSVALPVYNEREILPELIMRLQNVLRSVPGGPHEIVFADDGSADGSFDVLASAANDDPTIKVVRLARNFGHQIALSAALDQATGDVVILMDSDLQDLPETIPAFLEKFAEGYDVVFAQREKRKEHVLLRVSYFVFYRLIAWFAGVKLPLDAGDFSLVSRRVADLIRQAPERHRYLRGLRAWAGYRQVGIPVERAARTRGETKYTLRRLMGLAFDGLLSFSIVPLRAVATVGFLAILIAGGYALYAVIDRIFFGRPPAGFTALIVAVTFLSGVQLLFLGLVGEYVGRIYEEVKRRPLYVIDRVIHARAERIESSVPARDTR